MKINKLYMNNVRSYKSSSITFPSGTVLFEGDIGSGKSTILLAIEFALFGLGDLDGANLLRIGEKQGSVKLEFDVDGKKHEVFRSLMRRDNSVRQKEGYIVSDGARMDYSPTELKARILKILNFNERTNPRATSLIYRYAVFTPQEQMKEILEQKPDQRLATLRKAFGIEEYNTVVSNASLLKNRFREGMRFIEGRVLNFEENKDQVKRKQNLLDNVNVELKKIISGLKPFEDELSEIKSRLKELEKLKERVKKLEGEIPHVGKSIAKNDSDKKDLQEKIDNNQNKLNEYSEKRKSLLEYKKPTLSSDEEIKDEIKRIETDLKKHRDAVSKLEGKIEDYSKVLKDGRCPVCDRETDSSEFNKKITDKEVVKKEIQFEIQRLEEKLEKTRYVLESLKEYNQTQEKLKDIDENIQKLEKEIKEGNAKIKMIDTNIAEEEKQLTEMKLDFAKNEDVFEKYEEFDKKREEIDGKLKEINSNIASKQKEAEMLKSEIIELNKEIINQDKLFAKLESIKQYATWIDEFFIPTVETIEKHVLISINEEFNSLFQRMFGTLIESNEFSIRVDENFTPIVEQNGYELNVSSLSGGERTSVALAYRLALNTMVKKVCNAMHSNLLILDEPTDGFSKEQLFKLRDVLHDINCEQIILVSHERELESFSDSIFRINKEGNVSKIMAN